MDKPSIDTIFVKLFTYGRKQQSDIAQMKNLQWSIKALFHLGHFKECMIDRLPENCEKRMH